MDEPRLPTELWVMAHVRRAIGENIVMTVVRKGEPRSGTVLIKVNRLDGTCRVLTQARDVDGRLAWLSAFKSGAVAEAEADAYVTRAVARDPDLWVVEIEDRQDRQVFEGRLL